MINLEKVAFPLYMGDALRNEVKNDMLKFELEAQEIEPNTEIKITCMDKDHITINCGYLKEFKFPANSSNPRTWARGSEGRQIGIGISFNYNNRDYAILAYNSPQPYINL
jgi:hypothetical protein